MDEKKEENIFLGKVDYALVFNSAITSTDMMCIWEFSVYNNENWITSIILNIIESTFLIFFPCETVIIFFFTYSSLWKILLVYSLHVMQQM